MNAVILLGSLILLIIMKVPVPVAMGISTVLVFISGGYPFYVFSQVLITSANSWSLLAVPFFIIAGSIMNEVGVTDRLFTFARACVGHIRGGLAHVNVLASMIFAGISGSSVADAAGLGKIELKAMDDAGYDRKLSVGITAASCVVGPIIPPSILFVLYGVIAQVSIAKLFLAGLVPGVLIGVSLMVTCYVLAVKYPDKFPREQRATLGEFSSALKHGILAVIAPVLILLGMTSGLISPTEAGAGATVYSLFLGIVYKSLRPRVVWGAVKESMVQAAHAMLLVALAGVMGFILTFERVPHLIAEVIGRTITSPVMILIVVNLLLLVIGCFMSATASLIILTPILLPLMRSIGVDPIHFGVMITYGLTIGVVTPPVGVALYILTDLSGLKFEDTVRGTAPFLIPLVISLVIITAFPRLTLWLPSLMR